MIQSKRVHLICSVSQQLILNMHSSIQPLIRIHFIKQLLFLLGHIQFIFIYLYLWICAFKVNKKKTKKTKTSSQNDFLKEKKINIYIEFPQ